MGFAEDRSPARVGSVPQGLAATRTTGIGLRRAHGQTAIAATRRAPARHPADTLSLIGLEENEKTLLNQHTGLTLPRQGVC